MCCEWCKWVGWKSSTDTVSVLINLNIKCSYDLDLISTCLNYCYCVEVVFVYKMLLLLVILFVFNWPTFLELRTLQHDAHCVAQSTATEYRTSYFLRANCTSQII